MKALGKILAVGPALVLGLSARAEPPSPGPEAAANPPLITIHADQPGPALNQTQYGVFFEEISHGGEGGLYAELVNNRSFEDSLDSIPAWSLCPAASDSEGAVSLESANLLNQTQSRALKLELKSAGGTVGVANEGYWGIHVVKERNYDLTFFAKSGLPAGASLTAKLQNSDGSKTYAALKFPKLENSWRKYSGKLVADDTDPKGRLVIELTAGASGSIWLDVVSLFPPTWKNRPNGTRPDIAEMIARMKPAIIRLPGGSYVSTRPAEAPRWLNEIGPIEERPGHPAPGKPNPWGYHNNDGFGFHEYLQFAEDLGAEPIYVFPGGADSRSELNQPETFLAGAALDKLIGDILAGLEYANGASTTKWGAKRAANGHPQPFRMKFIQIGNENFQRPFHENYVKIYRAIRDKYPEMQVIWGGDWIGNNQHGYKSDGIMPEGSEAQIVDEHFYKGDDWFYQNINRYGPANYPRGAAREAKIFVGEASAMADNLGAALKETAFLLGAERHSDKVVMAVYAPLLANVNFKKWAANAINFDNHRVFGTPSYHAQVMLANNVGDINLGVSGPEGVLDRTLFVNASLVKETNEILIKAVNPGAGPLECRFHLTGTSKPPARLKTTVLSAPDPAAGNSLENNSAVVPVETVTDHAGLPVIHTFPAHSFTILRLR